MIEKACSCPLGSDAGVVGRQTSLLVGGMGGDWFFLLNEKMVDMRKDMKVMRVAEVAKQRLGGPG